MLAYLNNKYNQIEAAIELLFYRILAKRRRLGAFGQKTIQQENQSLNCANSKSQKAI